VNVACSGHDKNQPILSRLVERRIVTSYIYPALQTPPPQLCFTDQFAFRLTGSTTAALIALLHTVCTMLSTNPFVRVFAIDFSKAFDSIRHYQLLAKMSCLTIPDEIYNWVENFSLGGTTVLDSMVRCLPWLPFLLVSFRALL